MQVLDFQNNIFQWATSNGLIQGSTPQVQYIKLIGELGEMFEAGSDEELLKECGDVLTVVCIMCYQMNILNLDDMGLDGKLQTDLSGLVLAGRLAELVAKQKYNLAIIYMMDIANTAVKFAGDNLDQALQMTWDKLKDRKLKLVNGVLIKESDL